MARPTKLRKVCCLPESNRFGPLDATMNQGYSIVLAIDEYETIRLIDLDGLTQEECSEQMHIARTTVQRIYSDARKKIADSLVNGKLLIIEGGDYKLCNGLQKTCGNGTCHRRGYGRGFREEEKNN